jgi:2-oxoisovalerate dehydrogenase E1 component
MSQWKRDKDAEQAPATIIQRSADTLIAASPSTFLMKGAIPEDIALAARIGPVKLKQIYRSLLLPRIIEEKALLLLRQGRLSKWFSGMGQEAIAVGVTSALEDSDWILPMHRNLGVFTTRGVDLGRLFRQLFGRDGGFTKGRDRTFHFAVPEKHIIGMISHLGAMLPVADGLALAARLKGTKQIAAAFSGEGATSEGDFHEAVNLAAVWKLPVIFVVENNQYALSTPTSEQFVCRNIADKAAGYGIPGAVVDGNNVVAVYHAVLEAAQRARRGEGPTLLEFRTFRMRGHEEASGTDYVPDQLIAEWGLKDPVVRLERLLLEQGVLSANEHQTIRSDLKKKIDGLVDEALTAPEPESTAEAELRDVFAPGPAVAVEPDPAASAVAKDMRFVDAISDALGEALNHNPMALLLGQDIAEYGGVFKVTEGFLEKYGRGRIRNTPIIESGAIGCALGLALDGFTPMVEMQFGDFISCGFNQIVNNLAKTHYRWGGKIGVVIRAPVGGGVGAGPFHSQNIESWFTSVAGLKVVEPSTPFDAKGLLLAAFEDGNPVLFLEHKFLYRQVKGQVPAGYYTLPIGQARMVHLGTDATIVTYGAGVLWGEAAVNRFNESGRRIELIDLRSLAPWDVETVVGSVKRTGRCLVLHEAPVTGGFGGEIAATIGREAFTWLDAPVVRLGALDTPVPFSKALEEVFSPKNRLDDALDQLLKF